MCKQKNDKVLITKNPFEVLETCQDPIYDKESEVYYSTPVVKGEIMF